MVIPQQLVTQLLDSVNYQVNTSSQQLDKPELQTVTKMYQLKKKFKKNQFYSLYRSSDNNLVI